MPALFKTARIVYNIINYKRTLSAGSIIILDYCEWR
jgi:hypothetical protein